MRASRLSFHEGGGHTLYMKQKLLTARPRLFRIVGPFIVVILTQALLAIGSLYTLSAVRAYVTGESMWSKGQKDAIHLLSLYVETGEEQYYRRFQTAIDVPLGDRDARLALEQTRPDVDVAHAGFMRGGNPPEDIPGMIWLYQNFRNVSYFRTAVGHWRAGDAVIMRLTALADQIYAEFNRDEAPRERRLAWKERIDDLNEQITPLSRAFSESLGEGSRFIKNVLMAANIAAALALIALTIWRTRNLMAQRGALEAALRAEKKRAQTTLSSIGQAVISTDAAGRVEYMNPAAERLIAVSSIAARGLPLDALFSIGGEGEESGDSGALVERILTGGAMDAGAYMQTLRRLNGSAVAVSLVGAPIRVDGRAEGAVLVFHDMTREKEYIARLSWQASHDSLTGLVNRDEFERRLRQALAQLARSGVAHALMFLDLDQFKVVNDTCGHAAGDTLLRQAAALLQRVLRDRDVLARIGGDEFGVLLVDCPPDEAADIAERLRQAIEELHFAADGRPFNVSVSIGLVPLSHAQITQEDALRTADMACYLAKEKGRNRVQVQNPSDEELLERFGEMAWVQRIRQALDENRFCLYAQDIAALQFDERPGAHVELLLRLRDEEGRLVPPNRFLPPAERYGLMPLIDRWVVRNAFELLADGLRDGRFSNLSTAAINLSGATVGDEEFLDYVRTQFAAHGVPPSLICFEITETSAIANLASATRLISALQGLGCRFALDDFGSGMSSFAYLKHLPVDYVKIDGAFVKDMLDDRIDRAMVEMINHIGQVTGKKTIAEFVENEAILAALRDIGVNYAQGFGVARPRPFDADYTPRAQELSPPIVESERRDRWRSARVA